MWTVAVKELREYVLTLRYQVAAILLVGLLTLSVIIGGLEFRSAIQAHQYSQAQIEQQRSEEASLQDLFRRTLRYQPAPSAHSVLAYGLTDFLTRPLSFRLHFWRDLPVAMEAPELAVGVAGLFPRPDLVYITAVVGFLLALAFVHDAVAGERMHGTLRLILSSPVSRHTVILGKILGAYLSLLLPLCLALAVGAAVLLVIAPEALGHLRPGATAAILGLTFLFLFWVASLGVAISAWCRRPATALLLGLLVWVIFVGAIPAAAPLVAAARHPTPPTKELDTARDETADRINDEFEKENPQAAQQMEGRIQARRLIRQSVQLEVDDPAAIAALTQVRAVRDYCLASPVAAYMLAAAELAGTGVESYAKLAENARLYNRSVDAALVARFQEMIAEAKRANPQGNEMEHWRVLGKPVPMDILPRWEDLPPESDAVLRGVAPATLLLLAAATLQVFLALIGFLRYDPL